MKRIKTISGLLYQAKAFAEIPDIVHGFGTRGIVLHDYLVQFGINDALLVKTNQIHGNRVHILDENLPNNILQGDAFITDKRGMVCFVRTADCVPILLCDQKRKVVGAVHAGWRGTALNVVGEAVHVMRDDFGCKNLMAAIGPCICPKCYEVRADVIEIFSKNCFSESFWKKTNNGSYYLDLKQANIELLKMSGLSPADITILPFCTSCHDKDFASYRRDRTEKSRQVNFIFVK